MSISGTKALIFRISIAVLILIIVLGYGLFQARNLIRGPEISVQTPQNGDNLKSPLVVVSGSATNISKISLDDRPIFVDKSGNFSEKLLVQPGYTIIKLEAEDKFGRQTQKLIALNYTANMIVGISNNTVGTTTGTSTSYTIQ